MREKVIAWLRSLADKMEPTEGVDVHVMEFGASSEIVRDEVIAVAVNPSEEDDEPAIEFSMPKDVYLTFKVKQLRRVMRTVKL